MSHDRSTTEPTGSAGASPTAPARRWSLATRLTLWYAASSFALFCAASLVLYRGLVANLDGSADRFLADQIHVLRVLLAHDPADQRALEQEAEWEVGARRYAKIYIRVLDPRGRAIVETPGMASQLASDVFPAPTVEDQQPRAGVDLEPRGGRPFRVMSARARSGAGTPEASCLVQVALDRAHEAALLAAYRLQLALVSAAALLVCAFVGHRIARRGVRPIEEISALARRISSSNLHERIGLSALPAELADLASTFNEMLDRLAQSFAKLARFSADLAHELRTPIHNLRGEVEVALQRSRSPEEYGAVLASFLDECLRLSRIIDGLLFLARAENTGTRIARERVDLARELEKMREFYEPAAREAGVRLSTEVADGTSAALDRTLLQRALGNLIDNALRHTAAGGAITIAVAQQEHATTIRVADTGSGIAREHLPRLFDRFYRVDASRAAGSGGLGLGLAIVKSIAELHGGSVAIESEPGRGTEVSVAIPLLGAAVQEGSHA